MRGRQKKQERGSGRQLLVCCLSDNTRKEVEGQLRGVCCDVGEVVVLRGGCQLKEAGALAGLGTFHNRPHYPLRQ